MKNDFTAKAEILINAPASKVWEALVEPAIIKQYMFGTDVITDWKVGSPIIYKGVWEGKEYEDKGNILRIEPGKYLLTNFLSASTGIPDKPENYHNVDYTVTVVNDGTKLTITQDNNETEKMKEESEKNWNMMLNSLKKLLEK